jgi:glycosyltransferase involved in cell wall biosynthesis
VLFLDFNYSISTKKNTLSLWKQNQVLIISLVFDLLPLQLRDCFTAETTKRFTDWLNVIEECSSAFLCFSKTVHDTLIRRETMHRPVVTLPFSGDIEASMPSRGIDAITKGKLEALKQVGGLKLLIVGTIEPRKGHVDVLEAVERIWDESGVIERLRRPISLVIVGRQGWMVDELCARLRDHPRNGTSLFWFERASDEALSRIYDACDVVIVASKAEGFGLPLVEAQRKGKPVIARNIEVFKEIASKGVMWFETTQKLTSLIVQVANHSDSQAAQGFGEPQQVEWTHCGLSLVNALNGFISDEGIRADAI